MGTLFKVLALTGPGQDAPAGLEPAGQPWKRRIGFQHGGF
jgi:hypothetical protein